jgi:hypothetical protein
MLTRPAVLSVLAVAAATLPLGIGSPDADSATPIVHTLDVSGDGVGMYPSYDPSIRRYAATTTVDTFTGDGRGGTLLVRASTSDPDGVVLVEGEPVSDGLATVTGLDAGDELSVVYVDSAGREADAVYVLPERFPTLTVATSGPDVAPGLVGLTLSQWQNNGWPQFEAVVDQHGVPAWTRSSAEGGTDLKLQPNGRYSASRGTTTPGRTGTQVVELDARFQPIVGHETVGLVNTDGHDSILNPDGSAVLLAYEPDAATGKTDSVIQEVDPQGQVVFQWDSSDLVDQSVVPGADYAHINSVAVVNDGADFLASFRNLSAVLLIARHPHDGFQPGDVVWKLGGRDSSFTFVDDPYDGPCGQHTASMLPNGDVMIFDDGSMNFFGALCVDPDDPQGPVHERPQSRMTVYRLDEPTGTATLVRSYGPPGRFTWFMGSAQYLPGTGNSLIGWSAARDAVLTELGPDGQPVLELVAEPSSNGLSYLSYRAVKFPVPDAAPPDVTVRTPTEGAIFEPGEAVSADYSCTDTGGSTLQRCGDQPLRTDLDTTTPGTHSFTVVARDGDGNETTVIRHYAVQSPVAPPSPPPTTPLPPAAEKVRMDVMVKDPSGSWRGAHVYGPARTQRARWRVEVGELIHVRVALANRGEHTDRCLVRGTGSDDRVTVTYRSAGNDVTRSVRLGRWRAPRVEPGRRTLVRITMQVAPDVIVGTRIPVTVHCRSTSDGSVRDAAGVRVIATGG